MTKHQFCFNIAPSGKVPPIPIWKGLRLETILALLSMCSCDSKKEPMIQQYTLPTIHKFYDLWIRQKVCLLLYASPFLPLAIVLPKATN